MTSSESLRQVFKIGLGPSSSHTLGPLMAAYRVYKELKEFQLSFPEEAILQVHLYGSLALTGKGHLTDKAIIWGLSGLSALSAETLGRPLERETMWKNFTEKGMIYSLEGKELFIFPKEHLYFHRQTFHPGHPNTMVFEMRLGEKILWQKTFFSIGGGVIAEENEKGAKEVEPDPLQSFYLFQSAKELVEKIGDDRISDWAMKRESAWHLQEETRAWFANIWQVMETSLHLGLDATGFLPGGLKLKKRAHDLWKRLLAKGAGQSPLDFLNWVNAYALAVSEQNAEGGVVVTAPTNGAAGIIPAVTNFYLHHLALEKTLEERRSDVWRMLATSGIIGLLYQKKASISGAEVGCQGEVGVASSMAAAGLVDLLGGNLKQVINAAEMAMEHHLGMTCDPIGGLVQIPCIERNAMGAVKAINAAMLALESKGDHFVSLDHVIKTMLRTGRDMNQRYKETSEGGLAIDVSLPEC
jgi:L-serine dehydratase